MTQKEIDKRLEDLKYDYDNKHITFFIEMNDDNCNQLFQSTNFDTIQEALDWLDKYCNFLDKDMETWLMYEVEDNDIDRFADIVYKNGKYQL